MTRKRTKAEIAGIALFSFCFFVFVCIDIGAIYMAIHEQWPMQKWIGLLFFVAATTRGTYEPIQRRLKPSPKRRTRPQSEISKMNLFDDEQARRP